MKKGFISSFVGHYPKALTSVLVFMLAGVSFLNTQLNFDIPASTKVRDAAGFTTPFTEVEKLDLHTVSAVVPATNYARSYRTSIVRTTYASANYSAPTGANFSVYTVPTSDNSYINPYETNALSYKTRFVFGHSSNALNWVKSAYEGSTVAVNRNGGTETYQIVKKITLPISEVKRFYYSISESASYRGKSYDIAFMTCGDGTYGALGDDNSYRTFLFANRI